MGNIGYGDGKVYVSYATQGTNTVGRIEAFNADTLEPVWISEIASHNERSTEGAPYLVVNDAVASKLFMTMDIYILEQVREHLDQVMDGIK